MDVNCNAEHYKNHNKKLGCMLESVSLNFNFHYEGYGCYCSSFLESKEYKQNFYKIHKLDENEFLIIQTKWTDSPTGYIEDIARDIKDDYDTENKIILIFDTLLCRYSARESNRFLKTTYNYDKNDIDKWDVLDNSNKNNIDPKILKYTCDYLRDEYKISENNNGLLRGETVKLIMKGLNI